MNDAELIFEAYKQKKVDALDLFFKNELDKFARECRATAKSTLEMMADQDEEYNKEDVKAMNESLSESLKWDVDIFTNQCSKKWDAWKLAQNYPQADHPHISNITSTLDD